MTRYLRIPSKCTHGKTLYEAAEAGRLNREKTSTGDLFCLKRYVEVCPWDRQFMKIERSEEKSNQ